MKSRRPENQQQIQEQQIQEQQIQEQQIQEQQIQEIPLDLDLVEEEKRAIIINDILIRIYSKVKSDGFGNPISIVTQVMELVEKYKGLSGEDKKNITILVVKKMVERLDIIPLESLESIIETICFISKSMPKINTKNLIKKVFSKLKDVVTCKCFIGN